MNTSNLYECKNERTLDLHWLRLVDRSILVRSTIVAVVIGGILTVINQSGWITGRDSIQLLQLILVFLLPFAVVTTAQILGVRQARIDSIKNGTPTKTEGFFATLVSHKIPARAVVIGLVFGSLNAIITLVDAFLSTGNFTAVSILPLGQAYALPMLFGLLSQTISYRRYCDSEALNSIPSEIHPC